MPKRLLKLPRRLFGYQPSSVDQMIADRDSMLSSAEQRVRAAEARIAELEEELKRREEDLEAVKRQASDVVAPVMPTPAPEPELEHTEPPTAQRSETPTWMSGSEVPYQPPPQPYQPSSPEPTPPRSSAAELEDEGEVPEEMEEWPVPTVPPRTVFTPRSEPSADFDPMPIGGEEGDWPTTLEERWGTEPGRSDPAPPWQESIPHEGPDPDPWGIEEVATSPGWTVEDEPPQAEELAIPTSPEAEALAPMTPPEAGEPQRSPAGGDEAPPQLSVPPQITPAYMSEELANVVKAAEESATRIIERAWEATRTQISQVDRLWREVQAEIVRFAAWREHVDPLISTMQGYIDEARARIDEVPRRIQEALSPAAEAMAAVDAGMSEFAKASDLPQLLGRLHEVAQASDTEVAPDTESGIDQTERASFDPPHETTDVLADPLEQESEPSHPDDEPVPPRYLAGEESPGNGSLRAREGEDVDVARAIAHELKFINEPRETIRAPDNL
jgi:hypothetical protein